jgi:hypothetical protein
MVFPDHGVSWCVIRGPAAVLAPGRPWQGLAVLSHITGK